VLRIAAALSGAILLAMGTAYYLTYEPAPQIYVQWRRGITQEYQASLERRFLLVNPVLRGDRIRYDLLDIRRENIEALIKTPDVAETDSLDRVRYTLPVDFTYGESTMWIGHRLPVLRTPGVAAGLVLICAATLGINASARVRAARRRV
jgi:hypothetical protein